MPSLLESVTTLLDDGDGYEKLGGAVGGDEAEASSAAGLAVPAILRALADRATDHDGADVVLRLLDDGGIEISSVGEFLDEADPAPGNAVLDDLFGPDRDGLVGELTARTELGDEVVDRVLPMVAPLVVDEVRRRRAAHELDGAGVAELLASERRALARAGAGDRPDASSTAGSRPGPPAAGGAAGRAAAGGPTAADVGGLAWLGWALGAMTLVLLLAWMLSACDDRLNGAEDRVGPTARSVAPRSGPGTDGEASAGVDAGRSGQPPPSAASMAPTASTTRQAPSATTGPDESGPTGIPPTLPIAAVDPTVSGRSIGPATSMTTTTPAATGSTAAQRETPPAGLTLNELLELAPIAFAASSEEIAPEGEDVLDLVAEYLLANPGFQVEVGGHTDNDGAEDRNLDLSQRRAEAVVASLVGRGVDGSRLAPVGYGEARPRVPNDSSAAKAENRRIEFTVR